MDIKIRYGIADDARLLCDLGAKTFFETFSQDNRPEDIAQYLANAFSIEQLQAEIADPKAIFFIAEIDNLPVGYAKLTIDAVADNVKDQKPVELQRLYSLQEYVGKGIGAALMAACIGETKERQFNSLWLGVWEHNHRAIKFYRKWGFQEIGSHIFMLGSDKQNDLIMELQINS